MRVARHTIEHNVSHVRKQGDKKYDQWILAACTQPLGERAIKRAYASEGRRDSSDASILVDYLWIAGTAVERCDFSYHPYVSRCLNEQGEILCGELCATNAAKTPLPMILL
jgi:hypothetical protein